MKRRNIILTIAVLLSVATASAQTVSHVTAEQVGKTIHVSYDLDKQADISVFLSIDGGKTFKELQYVTGDVGEKVHAGNNSIVWNVLEELDRFEEKDVVFKVEAVGKKCPLTMRDYDGNVYNTILIGGQCWMKENLRTTHYADGTSIAHGEKGSSVTPYYYVNPLFLNQISTYGYYYNQKAVLHGQSPGNNIPSGIQGVCPKGWHVPSDLEWMQLVEFVENQSKFLCDNKDDIKHIGKSLASTEGWKTCSYNESWRKPGGCAIGYSPLSNDATGFSAVPAGSFWDRVVDGGPFLESGEMAIFWSTWEDGFLLAWSEGTWFFNTFEGRHGFDREDAFSVRCIRD